LPFVVKQYQISNPLNIALQVPSQVVMVTERRLSDNMKPELVPGYFATLCTIKYAIKQI
jgi:hypothetical protein